MGGPSNALNASQRMNESGPDRYFENLDPTKMKVIVVTIAACQKMKQLEKFKELSDTLTEIFDQIGRTNKGVVLNLNIHANRTKVPMANADKVNEKVW